MNYKNFIYDEARGFVFAYVPKVACTNWKSLLRFMAGEEDWLDNRRAHDKVGAGLYYLDLQVPDDLAIVGRPTIRKYTMVRDPYTRLLSAYLNKIENRVPDLDAPPTGDHFDAVTRSVEAYRRSVLGNDAHPQVTFEVFLRWLENPTRRRDGHGHFRADEHWTPQTVLLRQPDIRFDIVGRFERLEEDAAHLLEAMGCTQPFPTQKDVKFAPTNAAQKAAAYYGPTERDLVARLYADDFKSFGYAA